MEKEAEEAENARQIQLQQLWEEAWSLPPNPSSSASETGESPEPISLDNGTFATTTTSESSPTWDMESPDHRMSSDGEKELTPPTSPEHNPTKATRDSMVATKPRCPSGKRISR